MGTGLYSLGGFSLPFWTVGSIGLLCAAIMFFLLPEIKRKEEVNDKINKSLTAKDVIKVLHYFLPKCLWCHSLSIPVTQNTVDTIWQLCHSLWKRLSWSNARASNEEHVWGKPGSSWGCIPVARWCLLGNICGSWICKLIFHTVSQNQWYGFISFFRYVIESSIRLWFP